MGLDTGLDSVVWEGLPGPELCRLAQFSPSHGVDALPLGQGPPPLGGQRNSFPALGAETSGPGFVGPGGWLFRSPGYTGANRLSGSNDGRSCRVQQVSQSACAIRKLIDDVGQQRLHLVQPLQGLLSFHGFSSGPSILPLNERSMKGVLRTGKARRASASETAPEVGGVRRCLAANTHFARFQLVAFFLRHLDS
jgi:hypothetical protein